MEVRIGLLIFILFGLFGCKKGSGANDLSDIIINRQGTLRVECKDCVISYRAQNKDYKVDVMNGSNDISFLYSSDFELKTELLSKEEQNIRVVVIDYDGQIVSNELKSYDAGEFQKKTFVINMN